VLKKITQITSIGIKNRTFIVIHIFRMLLPTISHVNHNIMALRPLWVLAAFFDRAARADGRVQRNRVHRDIGENQA
jgi:hypothetical protein